MVLLIDNYDSFTYNLVDYIQLLGKECHVIRNDAYNMTEIKKMSFESIVISPGPCTPKESGCTMSVIEAFYKSTPILGICLGHQAIGTFFGAKLTKAALPMHGKVSRITVENKHALFKHLPKEIDVMRYHSLILTHLKKPLRVIAHTSKNEIMAIAHESLPIVGFQFHPESILSKEGLQLLKNWFEYY